MDYSNNDALKDVKNDPLQKIEETKVREHAQYTFGHYLQYINLPCKFSNLLLYYHKIKIVNTRIMGNENKLVLSLMLETI